MIKQIKNNLFIQTVLLLIIGGLVAFLAVIVPIHVNSHEELSIQLAWARVTLSAITIPALLFGFYLTSIQLRKSMAKPKIKVAFNEKGEQNTLLTYASENIGALPHPFITNEGNTVARYFQLKVIIPNNIIMYNSRIFENDPKLIKREEIDTDTYSFTYTNDGRYTLFVNDPYFDPIFSFESALDYKKCVELFPSGFTLKYIVYGDWGEPQEGELKITINQQEVSHAHS
jgi:hypothetical protein